MTGCSASWWTESTSDAGRRPTSSERSAISWVPIEMFGHLHITSRGERIVVGIADVVLGAVARLVLRSKAGSPKAEHPKRILLLRLERVGDLLMVLDAIAMIREGAPAARIDLVVGTWNRALAELI